jgi:hypothetical protein
MTDGFDVVAVGIENKRSVIMRMILRPNAGRPIVAAARNERRRVKRPHLLPAVCAKSNVHRRLTVRGLMNPEGRIALQVHAAEPSPAFAFHQQFNAQRSEGDGVERLAARVIGDLNTDMVEKQMHLARSCATVLSDIRRVLALRIITVPVSCTRPERRRLSLV